MALVAFAVLFTGVVSSALTASTTALLLAFILPVSLRTPLSSIPDRLAGWEMSAALSLVAIGILWPAPRRDSLRGPVVGACTALAARLRAEVTYLLQGGAGTSTGECDEAVAQAKAAVERLNTTFYATPYRPTGLSTGSRGLVRLVDEVSWLAAIVGVSASHPGGDPVNLAACRVKSAAACVLEQAAQLLDSPATVPGGLVEAVTQLRQLLAEMERDATKLLPVGRGPADGETGLTEARVNEFISSLDPSFRAQELSFAALQIAENAYLAAASERRGWLARLTGRQPVGLATTFGAAQERAASHFERHSVTLHNSVRGAVGLGLAVLVAEVTGVQHSFWVVLGTLSVLRSNALNTGQTVLRGLSGTVVGFVIGAAALSLVGMSTVLLWVLLPISILVAGIVPAAISFAAGQAGFTVVLVVLFNIVQPVGWRVGLYRVEDIALGCAVSLVVGLLFWPRGAAAALRQALAEAYSESARYLASSVEFTMSRGDASVAPSNGPSEAAASRRLDDSFRGYLAERGVKPVPLAEVTALLNGVVGLRLAADAVLDLWQRDDGRVGGDRAVARLELRASAARVAGWYEALAASLVKGGEIPPPLERDLSGGQHLVDGVRNDLSCEDGSSSAAAVKMIWTGDHLDAARRLQGLDLLGPPISGFCDKFQAASPRRAFVT